VPESNQLRKKYKEEVEIDVISIQVGSPIEGGVDPLQKPFKNPPCLTAMSPNGEMFAVAYADGGLVVYQATDCKPQPIRHCGHEKQTHKVMWMYFLNESSLVAEYSCGEVYKYCLGTPSTPRDADALPDVDTYTAPRDANTPPAPSSCICSLDPPQSQSPSDIFSTCSRDRSTILRLVRNPGHQGEGTGTAEGNPDGLIVMRPGESISAHVLDCRSLPHQARELQSLPISEDLLLDPKALAISRDNQYAAVVLLERSQRDTCRRMHMWSIKEGTYLTRNVQGSKSESWIPANYFDGDAPLVNPDSIVHVYHHDDVPSHEGDRRHESDNWVYYVVHDGQTEASHRSARMVTFTRSINRQELPSPEFAYDLDMRHLEMLTSCVCHNIRTLRSRNGQLLHDTIKKPFAAFIETSNTSATRDIAVAARNVVLGARDLAKSARDAAEDAATTCADCKGAAEVAALASRLTALAALVFAVVVDSSLVDITYAACLQADFDNALHDARGAALVVVDVALTALTAHGSANDASLDTTHNATLAAARDTALSAALSASRAAAARDAGEYKAAYKTSYPAAYAAARDAVLSSTRNAAHPAARSAARPAVRNAAHPAARDAVLSAARDAALSAALETALSPAHKTALAPGPADPLDAAHAVMYDAAYAAAHDVTRDAAFDAVRNTAPTAARDITCITLPSNPRMQCYGILKGKGKGKEKEFVQIPRHLVLPPLVNPPIHPSHQCGGSRVVLGGHAHPYNRDMWVPVSILTFRGPHPGNDDLNALVKYV